MSESARIKFASLTNTGQQVFLAHIGLHLTICGRDFILGHRERDAIGGLAGLNELQHKLLGQITGLGTDRERYPDDVFWAILHETAENYSIGRALDDAIAFAISRSN